MARQRQTVHSDSGRGGSPRKHVIFLPHFGGNEGKISIFKTMSQVKIHAFLDVVRYGSVHAEKQAGFGSHLFR